MKNTIRKSYRGYVFRKMAALDDRQLDQLIAIFGAEAGPAQGKLGGRRRMPAIRLDRIGRVVIKCYQRGGLIGIFNRRYYMRAGATRSEKEFEWLRRVRMLGINAPEPIAAAHRGALVYRCWLVTREVADAVPLAQMRIARGVSLEATAEHCNRQAGILVGNNILHPDLHPGNVLVDPQGQAWLIDFDKAVEYRGRRPRLAARYRQRWQRAVHKHNLADELAAMMHFNQTDRPRLGPRE